MRPVPRNLLPSIQRFFSLVTAETIILDHPTEMERLFQISRPFSKVLADASPESGLGQVFRQGLWSLGKGPLGQYSHQHRAARQVRITIPRDPPALMPKGFGLFQIPGPWLASSPGHRPAGGIRAGARPMPGDASHLVKCILDQVALVPLMDDKDAVIGSDIFVQLIQFLSGVRSCKAGRSTPWTGQRRPASIVSLSRLSHMVSQFSERGRSVVHAHG